MKFNQTRSWVRVSCLFLIVFQWGCRKVNLPAHYDSGIELASEWRSGKTLPGPVSDRWWMQFNDASLTEIIEACLLENRDLKSAAARVNAAMIQSQIAGTHLKPGLTGGLSGDRRRQNFIGLPIPGAEGGVLSRTFTSLGLSLNVSWEADIWGRLKAGELMSLARFEEQEALHRALQLSLAAQTAKIWFATVELKGQLELAKQVVESYEQSAELLRNRFEAGVRSALELRSALTDLDNSRVLVHQHSEQLERSKRQLEILLSRYPAGEIPISSHLPSLPGPVPAGVPAEVLARRPDVRAAEARLLAADAQILQSNAALLPQLSLTTSAGTSSTQLLDLLNGNFSVWSLAGGILQPVFQAGRLKMGVDLSRAQAVEAAEVFAGTVLKALEEVESALASEGALLDRLDQLQNVEAQAQASLDQATARFSGGVGDVLAVLAAQRLITSNKGIVLAVKRLLLVNRIDLYLGLGGNARRQDQSSSLKYQINSESS